MNAYLMTLWLLVINVNGEWKIIGEPKGRVECLMTGLLYQRNIKQLSAKVEKVLCVPCELVPNLCTAAI